MKNAFILFGCLVFSIDGLADGDCGLIYSGATEMQQRILMPQADGFEELQRQGMLPRGSALITSSGELAHFGITAIVHAASGAASRSGEIFEPTLKSVKDSVLYSILLAHMHGHERVAIPFIGSGIFAQRMRATPIEVANEIISGIEEARQIQISAGAKKLTEVVYVTFAAQDAKIFRDLLKETNEVSRQDEVVQGDITDFKIHRATAIVNAANMEVRFGGGVSGAIGRATGRADQIDREAQDFISKLKN